MDIKHLHSEKVDSTIMNLLREFKGTAQEFIKSELMGKNSVLRPVANERLIFTHNVRLESKEMSPKEIAKAYESNEQFRVNTRVNQNFATHSIISFHANDSGHLDNTALKSIMQQYISLRNANAMYTLAVHRDRSFVHVHAIESSIEYMTGKSTRISRDQFKEIKQELQRFQEKEFPGIKYSSPQHDKTKEIDKGSKFFYKNAERTYLRDQIHASVTTIVEKSTSMADFTAKVHEAGYSVYSRSGKVTGIQCNDNGLKMRFSRMGLTDKINGLDLKNERMEKDLKDIRNLRSRGKELSKDRQEAGKENSPKAADGLQQELNELSAMREERHNEEGREQVFESNVTDTSDQKDNSGDEEHELSDNKTDDDTEEATITNDIDDVE